MLECGTAAYNATSLRDEANNNEQIHRNNRLTIRKRCCRIRHQPWHDYIRSFVIGRHRCIRSRRMQQQHM